jgi:hypothetical protein
MKALNGLYSFTDWKESSAFERQDGIKVTVVHAEALHEGELAGTTKVVFIMRYTPDQSGEYDGWEAFEGTFKGKPSSAIFRHEGRFDPVGVDSRVAMECEGASGGLAGTSISFASRFEGQGPYQISLVLSQENE